MIIDKVFQPNQLLEINHHGYHLAEFIDNGIRIHNNKNELSYIFNLYTSDGIIEYSIPHNKLKIFLEQNKLRNPSKRTINKFKKKLKKLQSGVISIGMILEKLGKINQDIHN